MPPSMPNPQKRMTANPARPVARYRPGKAVQEESSDEEDEDEEENDVSKAQPPPRTKPQARPQKPSASVKQQIEEDDDEEGFVTDDEDGGDGGSPQGVSSTQHHVVSDTRSTITDNSKSALLAKAQVEDISSSEEEDESSEEEGESSSEDETPQRKFQRPTFIKKNERNASTSTRRASGLGDETANSVVNLIQLTADSNPDTDEQLRRKAQAELMIKDRIERDMLARAAGKKSWDDDDEVSPEQMVDDTDGLDPESEHQAWKLRELKRLKRDREAIEAREREIEELERRRNLTQEERDREDADYIAKQKEDRDEGRGKANFMARYHHKGAFFQDDENAELLKKRDVMGARFVDEVSDKSTLPEYMRVRDMTKLGKKGRTRYTDLKGQDTGRFGEEVKRWRGAGDDDRAINATGANAIGNIDERFLSDRERERRGLEINDRGNPSVSETQRTSRVSTRRYADEGEDDSNDDPDRQHDQRRSRSRSPRPRRRYENDYDDRNRRESYRPQRRRSYSRSRSRSITPPSRRKRSLSPYTERDKRRRLGS